MTIICSFLLLCNRFVKHFLPHHLECKMNVWLSCICISDQATKASGFLSVLPTDYEVNKNKKLLIDSKILKSSNQNIFRLFLFDQKKKCVYFYDSERKKKHSFFGRVNMRIWSEWILIRLPLSCQLRCKYSAILFVKCAINLFKTNEILWII